jgi:carbon starvation protein
VSLPLLAILVIAVLVLGYRFYGGFIARQYRLDPAAQTPAEKYQDGVDFVPTKPFYLMGQHFSAIAAAGPIAGPILACKDFGWLPCILWIAVGVVFIGAVHDFSTLVASVRHGGKSIAEVVRANLGQRAWVGILLFIYLALIYVIVAFVDVTATTFVTGDAETAGLDVRFNPGGAVAMSSMLYLGLALVMGLVDKLLHPPLWLQTIIFVPLTLVAVWAGTQWSTVLLLDWQTWTILILGYCFVASLAPMWLLLQPRGYLGGFILYLALLAGVIGIFFGGFEIQQSAFKGFEVAGSSNGMGMLFPFLFVTIACGACSGFHGLVCSGTTSKQIARETHCHPIGYGAMLLEAFVALIALATIMIVSNASVAGKGPGAIYGEGLGRFVTVLIGEEHFVFAATFGAMAFSTFVFDTIDVATRLGRYLLQELFGVRGRVSALVATAVTCLVPMLFLLSTKAGSYRLFWTLFGTSNQLLAGLSLLAISVWLRREGRRAWYTLAPMVFVMVVTLVSLALQARVLIDAMERPVGTIVAVNGVVSVVLIGLAGMLMYYGARALRETQLSAR